MVVVGEDILLIRSGPPAEAEAEVEREVVVVAAGGETTAIDIAARARIRKGALTNIAIVLNDINLECCELRE